MTRWWAAKASHWSSHMRRSPSPPWIRTRESPSPFVSYAMSLPPAREMRPDSITDLDVEVLDVFGVGLYELLARRHVVAHQDIENLAGMDRILDVDAQQNPILGIHGGFQQLLRIHFAQALEALHRGILGPHLLDDAVPLPLRVRVMRFLAGLNSVERRLRDVQATGVDDLAHVAEEEGEKQRPDVRAIHVGVGHDNDAPVAQFLEIEAVADAGAERRDQIFDLVVGEDLVQPRLLDVEDLAFERQDCLEVAVAPLLGRAARRISLDEIQLALLGVALLAVGQFSGQGHALQRRLANHQIACFAGRFAGPGCRNALLDDAPRVGRVLVQIGRQLLVDGLLGLGANLRIRQLDLGLGFELRLRELGADNRRQPLTHVIGREIGVLLLQHPRLAGVRVQGAGERRAEAGQMRAAVRCIDGVGESEDRLGVVVRVLESNLDAGFLELTRQVNGTRDQRLLVLVEMAHEGRDTAFKVEAALASRRFLKQANLETPVEIGHLTQALDQKIEVECRVGEDRGVSLEGRLRASPACLSNALNLGDRLAFRILLAVFLAVTLHLDLQPGGQRAHGRHADAMQAAGDLVPALLEFAAGVQTRHDDFERRPAYLRMNVNRNAATVVLDGDFSVGVQGDLDRIARTLQRLVNAVVHHLAHELVQAPLIGPADVHSRTAPHALQTFQNLDIFGGIRRSCLLHLFPSSGRRTSPA